MYRRKLPGAIALMLLTALITSGHDTWLLARRTSVTRGTTVWLDLTSGMAFPGLDTSIKPDRIDIARCRLNGKSFDITDRTTAPKSLALRVPLPESGVATIWVKLKPRSLELTPKQVEEYLAEIDAIPAVRQAWANAISPKRWREIYVKHAKTFVGVGETGADRSWAEPVGISLEIVPEKNPTALRAGDELPVRVLKDGAPLGNFAVGIVRTGKSHGQFRKTDAEGRVVFKLTRAGKWMLRGTELRQSTKPDNEWESDFTTLAVEVR